MNVNELIALLQRMPQHVTVLVPDASAIEQPAVHQLAAHEVRYIETQNAPYEGVLIGGLYWPSED